MKPKPPAPESIRRTRLRAGLTQAEAAKLAGVHAQSRWSEYESGIHAMPPYRWELFLIKLRGLAKARN